MKKLLIILISFVLFILCTYALAVKRYNRDLRQRELIEACQKALVSRSSESGFEGSDQDYENVIYHVCDSLQATEWETKHCIDALYQ